MTTDSTTPAGSRARIGVVPSIHAYGVQLRDALRASGRLVAEGEHLRLTEDYLFASPSTAMVMLGRTSNGRVEWRTAAGKTLRELQSAATTAPKQRSSAKATSWRALRGAELL